MENKDDWKEIEKWAEEEKRKKLDFFKMDIDNTDEIHKNTKKVNTVVKHLNRILKTVATIYIIILVFTILIAVSFLLSLVSGSKSSVSADIYTITQKYGTKINIVSKDVDEHENGKYIFELKNNKEIRFTEIKNGGSLFEDFAPNLQKYIFDSWNSSEKEKFLVEETIDERGLLSYKNYIIVNDPEKVDEATELLIDFLEYAEKWNKENKIVNIWQQKEGQFVMPIKVYIQIQGKNIRPYNAMFQTAEEVRGEVKKLLFSEKCSM